MVAAHGHPPSRSAPPGGPRRPGARRRPSARVRRRRAALAALVVVIVGAVFIGTAASATKRPARASRTAAAGHRTTASPGDQGTPVAPSMFSPGACVSFSPTSGNRHQTVFLDAGHGGIDPGAVGVNPSGGTVHEADLTLPVVLDTADLLRAQGFHVVLSRTAATSVARLTAADVANGDLSVQGVHDDVAARDICANLARATILLGVYFDAGSSPTDAGSVTAYDTARPFAAANLRLSGLVQTDVLTALNAHGWAIPDDGVVSDVSLGGPPLSGTAAAYGHLLLLGPARPGWFDTPSEMPGALIEPLYVTDPFEASVASSPVGQEAIAVGLDQAVQQYFAPAGTGSSP